jgi:single-stranded-DNA-specific exonuclease
VRADQGHNASSRCSLLNSSPSEACWRLPPTVGSDDLASLAAALREGGVPELPPELLVVLHRRGLEQWEAIAGLLDPAPAPEALDHFPGLEIALLRLEQACRLREGVAICGDYDADGMTSTALLVGVLRRLGARPQAAIPSRMADGYGLNPGMVERLAAEGLRLLVTVDNGVSAREALERAQSLGVEVILTDHHSLPEELPPHLALLHPAVTPERSPYRGLAGVGLAHLLASSLCRRLGRRDGLEIAQNLFCIGTIADMAPLHGVNRRWLIDGLPGLRHSPLAGLRALQQIAGLEDVPLDAEAVGFQLAPRINAVGRLGDPLLVVDLLTTTDAQRAQELARACEVLNRQRKELCQAIEAEALALLEADGERRSTFLLLAQSHWHHGVIGIVAARLVERFGRPVALLAGDGDGRLRASVRAPKGFAVDRSLAACADLLEHFGGHPAAGGFTVRAEVVARLHERLDQLAEEWLGERGSTLPVEPEALLPLERIDEAFWRQLQRLEPFGIGNPAPIFWSTGCRIAAQKVLRGCHLQLQLEQGGRQLRAMAWRWTGEQQLDGPVDVAYRIRRDRWQGVERLQLDLVGLRPSPEGEVMLRRGQRAYWCRRRGDSVVVRNAAGREVMDSETDHPPYVRSLLEEAAMALGLAA